MEGQVTFLGILEKEEIKRELNLATAFIHSSSYETFSVVCAEAVACGCPVIANKVGGIPEFIDSQNGILVEDMSRDFPSILNSFAQRKWSRYSISLSARERFQQSNLIGELRRIYLKSLIL